MYMIIAYIRPQKWTTVHASLRQIEVERMTVADVLGFADQSESKTTKVMGTLTQYVFIEIIVNDDFLERTVEAITKVARTGSGGRPGDGKIFVVPVDDVMRLYDGHRGKGAV